MTTEDIIKQLKELEFRQVKKLYAEREAFTYYFLYDQQVLITTKPGSVWQFRLSCSDGKLSYWSDIEWIGTDMTDLSQLILLYGA